MWVLVQEAVAVVQVRDDGDLRQGDGSGHEEKWMHLEMLGQENGKDLVMDGMEAWR